MVAPAGISAQLGFAEEVTYGTYVAPTKFYDLVSDSIRTTRARLESRGLRAGRRTVTSSMWLPGARTVSGTLNTELCQVNYGMLLKHAMGAVATVNNADTSYTHTFTPGDLTGKSLTGQIGRPGVNGTVVPFSYTGCKINKWTLGCRANELATFDIDIFAQDETTSQALASATYPNALVPLSFVSGFLTVGGSQVDIHDITLSGDNKLDGNRLFLRNAPTVKEPLEAGVRDYTGTFTADFLGDLSLYNTYVTAGEVACVLTLQGQNIAGAHYFSLVVTMNIRYDGETSNVSGPALLTQPVPFKAIASGASDASAISLALTTTDATP